MPALAMLGFTSEWRIISMRRTSGLAFSAICVVMFFLPLTPFASPKAPSFNYGSIIVYLHDYSGRRNATVVPVVGISGKPWVFSSFGKMFTVDDPVTAAPSANSQVIERVQGVKKVGIMQLQGTTSRSDRFRESRGLRRVWDPELPIARGYAVLETTSYDPSNTYAVVLFSITLLPT